MTLCLLTIVVSGFGCVYRLSYAICQSWACRHPTIFDQRPDDDSFLVSMIRADPYGFTKNCVNYFLKLFSFFFFCKYDYVNNS